jgi:hypothetical protein
MPVLAAACGLLRPGLRRRGSRCVRLSRLSLGRSSLGRVRLRALSLRLSRLTLLRSGSLLLSARGLLLLGHHLRTTLAFSPGRLAGGVLRLHGVAGLLLFGQRLRAPARLVAGGGLAGHGLLLSRPLGREARSLLLLTGAPSREPLLLRHLTLLLRGQLVASSLLGSLLLNRPLLGETRRLTLRGRCARPRAAGPRSRRCSRAAPRRRRWPAHRRGR